MRRAVPALVALALLVGGCGKSEILVSGAQKAVVQVVSKKTSFTPTDVKCPSGVEAKVGGTFDCTFTGPQGVPYTAHMRITKVDGSRVLFYINTVPTK